jgi:hypothetical protein
VFTVIVAARAGVADCMASITPAMSAAATSLRILPAQEQRDPERAEDRMVAPWCASDGGVGPKESAVFPPPVYTTMGRLIKTKISVASRTPGI